jgi:mycothiol synthase
MHGAWFLWTSETSAAGRLYQSVGFTVTRRFYVCKKELA